MSTIHLKIITPKQIVLEDDVTSVTMPSVSGEMTVLPKHQNLFALLQEGIIKIKKQDTEDFMAIGGGYMETDGKQLHILVSRAYGQDAIDANLTTQAIEDAKKVLADAKESPERERAATLLKRSLIDMKLLRRKKHRI